MKNTIINPVIIVFFVNKNYPAMPYTAYAKLSDDDVSALYAYFMHGVKAVDQQPQKTELPFPFNLRFSMAGWNLLFLETKPFTPDASQSAEWNRGAYPLFPANYPPLYP